MSPSFGDCFGLPNSTKNLGRLYSSIRKPVLPLGEPFEYIEYVPVSLFLGEVKLPDNEPNPFVLRSIFSTSCPLGYLSATVIF